MLWLKEGIVEGDLKLENGWLFTTKPATTVRTTFSVP